MKKFFFSLAALCVGMCAMAQSSIYVHEKGGKCTEYLIENLDSISFTKGAAVTTGTENGYTWIDLGLSVRWATCNVGATNPEDYGDYYAWGETTTKSDYSWSTYKYGSDYDALTKYCTDSSYGTVDNKTTLEAADDAATQNWGSNWRMPTIDEWNELQKKCTWTWTTLNGKNGYEVKATNGNSIFLPAAGYRYDDVLDDAGSYGYYWSSSLYTNNPSGAQSVDFNSDGHNTYYSNRGCGRSVRPVVAP